MEPLPILVFYSCKLPEQKDIFCTENDIAVTRSRMESPVTMDEICDR